jgi:hypothetical protein
VIVTVVALAAVTDKVEAPPAATVVGLAEILTEALASVTLPMTPPHPTAKTKGARAKKVRDTNRRRLWNCCGTGKAFPRLSLYRSARDSFPAAVRAQFSTHLAAGLLEQFIG